MITITITITIECRQKHKMLKDRHLRESRIATLVKEVNDHGHGGEGEDDHDHADEGDDDDDEGGGCDEDWLLVC